MSGSERKSGRRRGTDGRRHWVPKSDGGNCLERGLIGAAEKKIEASAIIGDAGGRIVCGTDVGWSSVDPTGTPRRCNAVEQRRNARLGECKIKLVFKKS